MIPYILHVTVLITVCFLFYKLFLQKATFYRLNRWMLLTCLAVSFALPFLPVPQGWNWLSQPDEPSAIFTTTANAIASTGRGTPSLHPVTTADPIVASRPDKTPLAGRGITGSADRPVKPSSIRSKKTTMRMALSNGPATSTISDPALSMPAVQPSLLTHPALPARIKAIFRQTAYLFFYLYLIGVVLFGMNFLLQIAVLLFRSYTNPMIRDGRFRIVETTGNRAPCSFANNIFINPSLYDPQTYQQILIHEKIHVSGRHTLDILLAEAAVVLQWFNPFAWLYRREVENNLEFLTDESVLVHCEVERPAYQLSLLRVSAPHLCFSITNNYNQSLLKRRIIMMNSQRSSRHTIWKYFFLLPVLTILVCTLNKPAVFGQSEVTLPVSSGTSNFYASERIGQAAAAAHSRDTASLTRSYDDSPTEPVIVTAGATASVQASTQISAAVSVSSEPAVVINPSPVTLEDAGSRISVAVAPPVNMPGGIDLREGSWFVTTQDNKLEFELRVQDEDHNWETDFSVDKSEINPFPGQGTVEFKLVRDAGTMNFKGQFDGQQGFGHFVFQPDPTYFAAIKQLGVEDLDENRAYSFFALNIKKEYVGMLQRNGYTPLAEREVIRLSAMHVDEDFIKYWKAYGITEPDAVRDLISLKSLHIDQTYVDDLKAAGYDHLDVRQLMRFKAQHIDGNYARSMNAGNSGSQISPEELASYKAQRIDSDYLASLRKIGYGNLSRSEIRSLSAAHVTADYVKSFQDAGLKNIPPNTLVSFKIRDVTPDFVKAFQDLGYTDIEPNRLASLRFAGVTPDFVKDFRKIGYDNIPVSLLTSLKMSGVDAGYVAKMKEKGFNSMDLNKYIRLKRDFN